MNARIAEIQSRMLALQGRTAAAAAPATSSATSSVTSSQDSAEGSFASQLQDAVSASSSSTVNAAGRNFSLNSKGIPTELVQYGNGKLPASALEQVGGTNFRMWAPAADSLTRMRADAAKDGVQIGINETYRPYATQVDYARTKGLYSQGGLAAKPGTSEHGWGMAADLQLNGKAQSWMHQNAARYGFVNNVSRESWHWAYKPKTAS